MVHCWCDYIGCGSGHQFSHIQIPTCHVNSVHFHVVQPIAQYSVFAKYVPGAYNRVADSLSHKQMKRFCQLALEADLQLAQVPLSYG